MRPNSLRSCLMRVMALLLRGLEKVYVLMLLRLVETKAKPTKAVAAAARTTNQTGRADRSDWLRCLLNLVGDIEVAPTGGEGDCSAAEFVGRIDVGTVVDQQGGDIGVAFLSGQVQGRVVDATAGVNVGAGGDEGLCDIGKTEGSGEMESGVAGGVSGVHVSAVRQQALNLGDITGAGSSEEGVVVGRVSCAQGHCEDGDCCQGVCDRRPCHLVPPVGQFVAVCPCICNGCAIDPQRCYSRSVNLS